MNSSKTSHPIALSLENISSIEKKVISMHREFLECLAHEISQEKNADSKANPTKVVARFYKLMIGKSDTCKRLNALKEEIKKTNALLDATFKQGNTDAVNSIGSTPARHDIPKEKISDPHFSYSTLTSHQKFQKKV